MDPGFGAGTADVTVDLSNGSSFDVALNDVGSISFAPGGIHTAGVTGGLKERLSASQNPLERACGDASPIDPL